MESALIEHEAVKESAVVPSPDSDRGQVVKAFVVLSDKYKHVLGDETQENILKGGNFVIMTVFPLEMSKISFSSQKNFRTT